MPQLHFSQRGRLADLPLHNGRVPDWLAQRMSKLGGSIVEAILLEYGHSAFLTRISDPHWFQSFGAVLGMDWHSSGITTSVMAALKRALNPRFNDLGIYVCGGRGKSSKETPNELMRLAERTGLDGKELVHSSKLSAKVDNTAIQDGFQLYLHSFLVTRTGEWAVVQQGMNTTNSMARRYHWHSLQFESYIRDPHTAVFGLNTGLIRNLADSRAAGAQDAILAISRANDASLIHDLPKLLMPSHHEVRQENVDFKRLAAMLTLTHEMQPENFESLLLLKGIGPRTLQSLALVSEVIHGTPTRFEDPARFSFAHGGKDGHPFPVPVHVYDETISQLETAIVKARLGEPEKKDALRNLHIVSTQLEKDFIPGNQFDAWVEKEKHESHLYGGRTVSGKAKAPKGVQLKLF